MASKIIDNTNAGMYEKMSVPDADTKPLQKNTTNVCIAP